MTDSERLRAALMAEWDLVRTTLQQELPQQPEHYAHEQQLLELFKQATVPLRVTSNVGEHTATVNGTVRIPLHLVKPLMILSHALTNRNTVAWFIEWVQGSSV